MSTINSERLKVAKDAVEIWEDHHNQASLKYFRIYRPNKANLVRIKFCSTEVEWERPIRDYVTAMNFKLFAGRPPPSGLESAVQKLVN